MNEDDAMIRQDKTFIATFLSSLHNYRETSLIALCSDCEEIKVIVLDFPGKNLTKMHEMKMRKLYNGRKEK